MSSDRSSVFLQRQPRVALVGRSSAPDFRSLVEWLRSSRDVRIVDESATIGGLCSDDSSEPLPYDILIVLQSTSDEYTSAEANRLVGRMLFGRVLCCFSPWCQSDGRSHDVWPVSARVPVSAAKTLLAGELIGFRNDRSALLPLSAAEEVFAHRVQVQSWTQTITGTKRLVLVVSNELPLRDTVLGMCSQFGLIAAPAIIDIDSVSTAVKRLIRDFPGIGQLDVVVDLDPLDAGCLDVLHFLNTQAAEITMSQIPADGSSALRTSPHAGSQSDNFLRDGSLSAIRILGMTVFPESSISKSTLLRTGLRAVVEKTELLSRLTELLGLISPEVDATSVPSPGTGWE